MKHIKHTLTLSILLFLAIVSFSILGSNLRIDAKSTNASTTDQHLGQHGRVVGGNSKIYNKNDLYDDISLRSNGDSIPSSYDARDNGIVIPEKNQGSYSTCWSFASVGSCETNIQKKGMAATDLSELLLAYSIAYHFTDPLNLTTEDSISPLEKTNEIYEGGGDYDNAFNILAQWKGLVPEEAAPYSTLFSSPISDYISVADSDIYQKDTYHLINTERFYMSTPNRIKKALLETGCADFSYHAPESRDERNTFPNEDYTAYCAKGEDFTVNHAVLLVGWDDNYPVENFNPKSRPENPGAWLVRNSWGANSHDNGYLWISYEDDSVNLIDNEALFYDVTPASTYDNNYQYDSGSQTLFTTNSYSSMANIFTAQYKETLQAVSFQTAERNVNYEISIYDVTDKTNPESGTLLGRKISGIVAERGYHTIDFSDCGEPDIPLEKGDNFSIVIKVTNSEGKNTFLPYESVYEDAYLASVHAEKNESFLYRDTWLDTSDSFDANVRIKAFTKVDTSIPCEDLAINVSQISVHRGKTTMIPYLLTPADATNGIVTWSSSNEDVAKVSNGIIYAINTGEAEVTASINGHSKTVSVEVTEVPSVDISLPAELTLYRSQRISPGATLSPANSTDLVTYTSSDSDKVYVDNNGNLLGVSETGDTPVIITAKTSSGKQAICNVTVKIRNPYTATLADMQSPHPYFDKQTLYYEYAKENAIGYKVTFSAPTNFEPGCDYLQVLNSSGEKVKEYTSMELSSKTIEINDTQIRLALKSDNYTTRYGFKITEIVPIYATPTPTASPNPSIAPAVSPKSNPILTVQKPIVKKLTFKAKKKTVRVGKKINLSKYLKITRNRKGKVSISYQFTKKKFKKYASLSKKGVLKAKKKGIGKTLYVKAKANDGSKKTTKIKIVIKKK